MQFDKWLDSQDITQRDVARELGVTHQAVNHWYKGRWYPNPGHLKQLLKTYPDLQVSSFGWAAK